MDLTATTGYVPGFDIDLNLRELGGLPTYDGRHVRHGLFYRGSALVGLSPEERELVDAFGLRFMLDLRAAGEAAFASDYVPDGAEYLRCGGMRFPDGSEVDFSPEAIAKIETEMPEALRDGHFMESLYTGMAFGNPAIRTLVDHLVADTVPVYFHCTAGKDRTGVCALVIGMALGVTREAMLEDFLLTNIYRKRIIDTVADRMPADTPPEEIEMWKKANGVSASDAEAFLDVILERFRTGEAYLEQEFGVDADTLSALRDRYLT